MSRLENVDSHVLHSGSGLLRAGTFVAAMACALAAKRAVAQQDIRDPKLSTHYNCVLSVEGDTWREKSSARQAKGQKYKLELIKVWV